MGELDRSELIALEGRKTELEKASASGLSTKIPFIGAHAAWVDKQIERISGGDIFGFSEEDKKKEAGRTTATVIAAVQYEQALEMQANIIADGRIEGAAEYKNFGRMLENDKYWNHLQSKDAEMKKVANALAEPVFEEAEKIVEAKADELGLTGEVKESYCARNLPDTARDVCDRKLSDAGASDVSRDRGVKCLHESDRFKEAAKQKDLFEVSKSNSHLEELKSGLEPLGEKDIVEKIESVQAAHAEYEKHAGDVNANFVEPLSEGELVAKEASRVERQELKAQVHEKAGENGIANEREELAISREESQSGFEDFFANNPAIAAAAKPLRENGVESEKEAPKPTETQMAEHIVNAKAVDSNSIG